MKKQKQILTNFNEKEANCKMQNFFILVASLLIAIVLLIIVSIHKAFTEMMNYEKLYINKCIIKMSNKVKNIDIKNCAYYFLNNISKIKCFDPNNIKIREKSPKNTLIYYIGYETIKDLKLIL